MRQVLSTIDQSACLQLTDSLASSNVPSIFDGHSSSMTASLLGQNRLSSLGTFHELHDKHRTRQQNTKWRKRWDRNFSNSHQTSKQYLITAPSVLDGKISREHPGPFIAHTQLAVREESAPAQIDYFCFEPNWMTKNNERFCRRLIRIKSWIFRSLYAATCKILIYIFWWNNGLLFQWCFFSFLAVAHCYVTEKKNRHARGNMTALSMNGRSSPI